MGAVVSVLLVLGFILLPDNKGEEPITSNAVHVAEAPVARYEAREESIAPTEESGNEESASVEVDTHVTETPVVEAVTVEAPKTETMPVPPPVVVPKVETKAETPPSKPVAPKVETPMATVIAAPSVAIIKAPKAVNAGGKISIEAKISLPAGATAKSVTLRYSGTTGGAKQAKLMNLEGDVATIDLIATAAMGETVTCFADLRVNGALGTPIVSKSVTVRIE
jgi:hypothetical protein